MRSHEYGPPVLRGFPRRGAAQWGWLVMLWLVAQVPAFALNPARDADGYSLHGWFTEDGLPSNKIRDITQSRDGYLWLATGHGIARFDGTQCITFNSISHPVIVGNDFFAVLQAPDNSMWFAGGEGLFRWKDGRFDRFTTKDGLAHNYVRGLALTRDGTIVACTRKGYSFIRDGRISTPGGVWKQVTGVARAFLERKDGSMLLGTSTGVWSIKGEIIEQLSGAGKLQGTAFFSLMETPDETAWIGYSGGVHCLRRDGTVEDFGAAHGLTNSRVSALKRDRDGNVWIAASGNLYRMANGQIERAGYDDKFNGTSLHQLYEDREGALWIATVTGLFRLKDSVASGIGASVGLTQTTVQTVYEAPDGAWWLGLWYGGVYRYDGTRAERVPALAPLDLARVYSIAGEPDGTLWIGAESGLYRYADGVLTNYYQRENEDPRKQQLAEKPDTLLPGLAHNWVNSVALDGAGGIWAATDGALYHGVNGQFQAYTTARGMPGSDFESVIRTRSGEIWASVPGFGAVRLHQGRWTTYPFGKEIAASPLVEFLEGEDGAIWISTENRGVNRFKDGRWRTFTTHDGLVDNTICGLREDEFGFLWIAYPRGVMRIARREFDEIEAGKRLALQPRIFSQADGLPQGEITPAGKPNGVRTRDGRLLFATDLGLAIIDPRNLKINPHKPPVYIDRLTIDGVSADLSRPVIVPPGRNNLQIHYTAVSLLAPEKVKFKIRLAPLDKDWVESDDLRNVRYGQLAPGKYVFEVKGCNNDGVWNEKGASLAFIVRPYFYQTGWFVSLVITSAIAAGLAFISHRSRRSARQMATLAELVKDRTRELEGAKERAEAAVLAKNESIIALKQAQDQIAGERARFKFIFEAVPVGISLVQPDVDRFTLVNPAHERITGVTPDSLDDPDALGRATHPDDFALQAPTVQRYRDGQIDQFTLEKRYVHRDGTIVWAALTRRMFSDPVTGAKQSITTLIDITERRRAEANLAETHKQLLGVSRQAGMAEVATGVLHNVGNVLNSVNVSATLVSDRLRDSKLTYVKKLGVLLEEHAADLGAFFTADPRGRRIPLYVTSLADELGRERTTIINELADLRKNIEHIKEIVTMQQSFARVSGVTESVAVTELVEDALRMNSSSLARHGFNVVREYIDQPVATTERHKVMQVLVNLIRNAEQACESSDRPEKQVTLRITKDAQRARVAVIDNGVGIPAENLTRIFAHGFTTRRNGHGFGLHSGALVAKELGGALVAHSDGPGRGAMFTLELPLKSERLS